MNANAGIDPDDDIILFPFMLLYEFCIIRDEEDIILADILVVDMDMDMDMDALTDMDITVLRTIN